MSKNCTLDIFANDYKLQASTLNAWLYSRNKSIEIFDSFYDNMTIINASYQIFIYTSTKVYTGYPVSERGTETQKTKV